MASVEVDSLDLSEPVSTNVEASSPLEGRLRSWCGRRGRPLGASDTDFASSTEKSDSTSRSWSSQSWVPQLSATTSSTQNSSALVLRLAVELDTVEGEGLAERSDPGLLLSEPSSSEEPSTPSRVPPPVVLDSVHLEPRVASPVPLASVSPPPAPSSPLAPSPSPPSTASPPATEQSKDVVLRRSQESAARNGQTCLQGHVLVLRPEPGEWRVVESYPANDHADDGEC